MKAVIDIKLYSCEPLQKKKKLPIKRLFLISFDPFILGERNVAKGSNSISEHHIWFALTI